MLTLDLGLHPIVDFCLQQNCETHSSYRQSVVNLGFRQSLSYRSGGHTTCQFYDLQATHICKGKKLAQH